MPSRCQQKSMSALAVAPKYLPRVGVTLSPFAHALGSRPQDSMRMRVFGMTAGNEPPDSGDAVNLTNCNTPAIRRAVDVRPAQRDQAKRDHFATIDHSRASTRFLKAAAGASVGLRPIFLASKRAGAPR
jgi:hypothetical protein